MSIFNSFAPSGGGGGLIIGSPSSVALSNYSGQTNGQVQFQVDREPFCIIFSLYGSTALVLYNSGEQLLKEAKSGNTAGTLNYSYDALTHTVTLKQVLFSFNSDKSFYFYIA